MRWRPKETLICFWLSHVVFVSSAWRNVGMTSIAAEIPLPQPLTAIHQWQVIHVCERYTGETRWGINYLFTLCFSGATYVIWGSALGYYCWMQTAKSCKFAGEQNQNRLRQKVPFLSRKNAVGPLEEKEKNHLQWYVNSFMFCFIVFGKFVGQRKVKRPILDNQITRSVNVTVVSS